MSDAFIESVLWLVVSATMLVSWVLQHGVIRRLEREERAARESCEAAMAIYGNAMRYCFDRDDKLTALAMIVAREHRERDAWLASLPSGACTHPPPQSLVLAEEATRAALSTLRASSGWPEDEEVRT